MERARQQEIKAGGVARFAQGEMATRDGSRGGQTDLKISLFA
jgi:hypothetical protein